MNDNIDAMAKKLGLSRREFLKLSAQLGVLMGAAPFLDACGGGGHDSGKGREQRTYYFDLSHTSEEDEHYLVLGNRRLQVQKCDATVIANSGNPFLQAIPQGRITHFVSHDFPSDAVQACYIQTVNPEDDEGVWSMSLSFFHLPRVSVIYAALLGKQNLDSLQKFAYHGVSSSSFSNIPAEELYLHLDAVKSTFDMAVDLTFAHPEILCGESNSAAHIQTNILGTQSSVKVLGFVLSSQGPASESGGWATMEIYIDPTTGKPYLNSKGQKQYFPRYSDETNTFLGSAANSSLGQVKNDLSLGINITNLDPTSDKLQMNGKIWKIYDGITTVEGNPSITDTDAYTMDCSNKSRRHGYKATMTDFDDETGKVKIKVENWYSRYLGIYIQFLDSNGDRIKLSDLPPNVRDSFTEGNSRLDSKDGYTKHAAMLSSEWELLGIPLHNKSKEFSFLWPEKASSARIIAGGLGANGKELYEGTFLPGAVCTSIVNLGVPTFFLMAAVATAFVSFVSDLDDYEIAKLEVLALDLSADIIADVTACVEGNNPKAFIGLGKTMGQYLLNQGISWWFTKLMEKYVGEGYAIDSVPLIGKILAVIAAAGLTAQVAETVSEMLNSPTNYMDTLNATHNIRVKINHDPDDPAGFPAVADYYILTAMFDQGTTHTSGRIDMPGTTVTEPLYYTFSGVPYGGKVSISVGFFSDVDNWLAGAAEKDDITNDVDSIEITIKEIKVPLNSDTVYGHKQKIVLDADGNHVWEATTEAPSQKHDSLQCESAEGNLCELNGITVSEYFATLGYGWKSYSSSVSSCESGGIGQLNQFSTASIAQNPQESYLPPECGFSAPVRIVYDLMSSKNNNYYLDTTSGKNLVRQIRLERYGTPSVDKPDSDVCWGRFNLSSDALLLHPSRKLISINTALNKIEVLSLPETAYSDEEAPLSVAYSGTGTRLGLVKGPVAAAISPDGAILILESVNKRVQAFDTGMNPAKRFSKKTAYHFPLKAETEKVTYIDMAMEYTGYIYVLSYTASNIYRLDIYDKDGNFVSRTTGFNAAKMTVDLWRNVYALNYEALKMPDDSWPDITEPSVSQWIPSVP